MNPSARQALVYIFIGFMFTAGALGLCAQPTLYEWQKHLETAEKKIDQLNSLQNIVERLDERLKNVERITAETNQLVREMETKSWAVMISSLLGGGAVTYGGTALFRRRREQR